MTEIDDLESLLRDDTPLIDTRSPVEFAKGSLPTAVSLPLMMNDEREAVGTCYKEHGQDAAVRLGHELVSGDRKAQRVMAWQTFAEDFLCCISSLKIDPAGGFTPLHARMTILQ